MNKKNFIAIVILLPITLIISVLSIVLTVTAFEAVYLPYNSEGRYFDGIVVHHDGSIISYTIMAFVSWLITALMGWFAYRLYKPAE